MTENRCINCMRKRTDSGGACPHCGFDPGQYKPPEQTLPPGTTLNHGKYIIGRVLGRGGFGVTYVALDTTLDLRVAVKECLPRNCAWRNDSGASVQWGLSVPEQKMTLENFVKEARKMAKIDQIPGVVRVREYFYDNETAYIVMDYVEGETLAQYLRRNGPLNAEACFRVLAPAMDSLAQAHKRGLIHRDISPNNIMIETNGERVWVLDLGAAKDLGTRISAPNVSADTRIVGTPGYTPLEQYDPNGAIGPWTDVYAMSATFFRCMTGQKLPPSTSRALKDDAPELLRTIRGPVGAVLEKGLAQNPDDRYQSMSELRDALEKAIRQKKSKAPKPKTAKKEAPEEKSTSQPQTSKDNSSVSKVALIMIASLIVLIAVFTLIPLSLKMASSKPVTVSENEVITDTVAETSEPETATETQTPSFENVVGSGKCGDNVSWTVWMSGNFYYLTIYGTGKMQDYGTGNVGLDDIPWNDYAEDIFRVVILNGVTSIGANAFQNCASMIRVDMSNSVETIGDYTFLGCSNLQFMTMSNSVTKIGNYAFYNCEMLDCLAIPEGAIEIGNSAFYSCSSLGSVIIPDSVTTIGEKAFRNCENLKVVSISENTSFHSSNSLSDTFDRHTTTIVMRGASSEDIMASGEFSDNMSWTLYANGLLTVSGTGRMDNFQYGNVSNNPPWYHYRNAIYSVMILHGITYIGEKAFSYCPNLQNVEIADSVTEIGVEAFYFCMNLSSVSIPDSVKTIGYGAFSSCYNLFNVSIAADVYVDNAFEETTTVTVRP